MATRKSVILLVLLLVLESSGCSFSAGTPKTPPVKSTIIVYRPSQNDDLLYPEQHSVSEDKAKLPMTALNLLLNGQPLEKSHINIFPPNVKVLALKINNGLAEADFSKDLLKNEQSGSLYEMLLISSIVNTLTEFPEIKQVQLLVEGKKIDTFGGGHMDIIDPLRRNESLIKK
jgi:spore germination protein GerM